MPTFLIHIRESDVLLVSKIIKSMHDAFLSIYSLQPILLQILPPEKPPPVYDY